jgi:hypothetical protein
MPCYTGFGMRAKLQIISYIHGVGKHQADNQATQAMAYC